MKPALRSATVFLVIFGVFAGSTLFLVNYFRLETLTVTSGSMEPLMLVGDRLVIKQGADIKPNDIVSFHNPETGGITTHIFGGYNADGTLKTKGLANEQPDDFNPAPTQHDIIGKVVYHTNAFTAAYWDMQRTMSVLLLFGAAALLFIVFWMMGIDQTDSMPAKHRVRQPA